MTGETTVDGGASDASGASEASRRDGGGRGRLERTLGLGEAVTIGVGTMVGAGIFVFPGLAVAEAGPAAALSFVVGAAIALLVALPTSELATAMPRSGGGYFFVSRALGAGPGVLVGLGQWLGLVFASAFYLAGFGHYFVDVAGGLGIGADLPPQAVGFATAAALTAVGIVGTRTSGKLQYVVVVVLVGILTLFLGWGVVRATGLVGAPASLGPLAPGGATAVLTTAGLVFTSYLGFAQIANVAGEVKEPGVTLPRAMVGSVVLVGLLYAVTIVVSTAVLGTEAMARAGETAMTEVGRALLGGAGALVIGGAGLLATLSSANASIMSSSRAVYALSRDGAVPDGVSRVSRRFRTPHVALLLTGTPIGLLVLLGRIEVLAEVASILHLVMYALMCASVVVLRRQDSLWYRPTFRTPGAPWLPALGALLCLGLLAFMSPRALAYGGGILAVAGAWFLVRRGRVDVHGVEDIAPAPGVAHASLLLQMELPDPPGLPDALVRALSPDTVVLVGWAQVPEQSSSEQVRDELGDESERHLEEEAERLRGMGMQVETDLVFTGDLVETLDQVAEDRDVDALISLRPVAAVDEVLLALASDEPAGRAAGYAARIARATGAEVRIVRPAGGDGPDERADDDGLRRELTDAGVLTGRLRIDDLAGGEPGAAAVLEAIGSADLVILRAGETDADSTVSGAVERIMRKAEVPVLLVREKGRARGEPESE